MFFNSLNGMVIRKIFIICHRSTLETVVKTIDELGNLLEELFEKLVIHDFIARQQAQYAKEIEENLSSDCVLVKGDFAQNYSIVIQDAIQSHYWSTDQVTIHPWTCYYRDETSHIQNLTLVMVSDYLKHDVHTVSTFQRHLVNFLNSKIPGIKKLIYLTIIFTIHVSMNTITE